MRNKICNMICLLSFAFVSNVFADTDVLLKKEDSICVPEGKWISQSGDSHSTKDIIHTLSKTKVVLLGEDHDNPEHHRWQLQTLSAIYALESNMAIGFEAFPRSTQKILDKWVAGEIKEKDFLEAVDWDKIWRFNKDFYMPMFHFARMNRIPMYAINVNRTLVSKVGSNGWDNVPADEREGVSKPADPSKDYIEVLAQVFAQHIPKHAHGTHDDEMPELSEDDIKEIEGKDSFKRFLQGQLLWDRAMAEMLYKSISKDKHSVVVGILGAGHIMGNYGVPHQLNSLGITNIKTLMAWDGTIECQQLLDGAVDIAFGIMEIERKDLSAKDDRPRLGVYLENRNGVLITRIVKDSVALKMGIEVDDHIIKIAGKTVEKVSDVVKAVKATAYGTWLPLVVERNGEKLDLVAKFPARD